VPVDLTGAQNSSKHDILRLTKKIWGYFGYITIAALVKIEKCLDREPPVPYI
jgi:hypothetical protein